MNFWISRLRNLGKRWMYGAIATLVATGLIVSTPQPTQADISIIDLIFGGIQYIQLSNLSDDQEVDLGRQTDAALKRRGVRVYNQDAEVVNYVNNIGQRLAAESDRSDIPYTFQIVADDSINAFATSGGFVYVHTGLLRAADTEAELAGVMAHEIGHIVGRHSVNRMREIALANGIVGALGVSEDDLVNIGVQLALFLPNSRSAEYEADELGFENMGRAGYDQRGLISFMEKLSDGGVSPEFFSTHPDPDNRVDRLQSMYSESYQADATDGNNPEIYSSKMSGL
ncbi:M48 family metallopeptidase [Oscillatoria sp. CS-180]|uniref:M48 family metallopeptidase n=1 Tax=Oscillatoria sp. CS-180 TaxID=3021720 RepID=UPI00232E009A|nr:M48 family metallopeptidase [Oscillatoria sp. CS-180]MDB9528307.1 M48 family metallopeptidase [Oscillatoria sp. CS-180]